MKKDKNINENNNEKEIKMKEHERVSKISYHNALVLISKLNEALIAQQPELSGILYIDKAHEKLLPMNMNKRSNE